MQVLSPQKKSDLKKFKMNRSSEKDKIIEAQAELIKNLQKQIKEWEEWKTSSKDRHAKRKAKTDLAIEEHKNTLRINTTRKPKK
jgi:hypothetical protein